MQDTTINTHEKGESVHLQTACHVRSHVCLEHYGGALSMVEVGIMMLIKTPPPTALSVVAVFMYIPCPLFPCSFLLRLCQHQLCMKERESFATTLGEDETFSSSLGKSLGGETKCLVQNHPFPRLKLS